MEKHYMQLCVVFLIALIIWFLGPFIAVDQKAFLNSFLVRESIITILFLCWALVNLQFLMGLETK